MRYWGSFVALLCLSACSSGSSDATKLTLNDPIWDRVNVQLVITTGADCDSSQGMIGKKVLVMRKNQTESFDIPNDAHLVCWRHDRDPDKPVAGAWTGWTKATLFPGQDTETDL